MRHPGFVEVLDAGVCAEHGPYVVIEMLDGRTLDGILAARARLSIDDTVQIGRQVCDAVAHANARGVIHRDLKPSNVFVARNEIGARDGQAHRPRRRRRRARSSSRSTTDKLTTAHEVLGTPEYMAPEQLWGREIDARTDVYAIGMSLYECLTGEVPVRRQLPRGARAGVERRRAARTCAAKRPDVPPALALVIENALEKDARRAFQTAAELGRALVAASGLAPGASALLAASDDEQSGLRGGGARQSRERAIKLVRKKASSRQRESASGRVPSRASTDRTAVATKAVRARALRHARAASCRQPSGEIGRAQRGDQRGGDARRLAAGSRPGRRARAALRQPHRPAR